MPLRGSQVKVWAPEHGPRSVFFNCQVKSLGDIDLYQQHFQSTIILDFQWMLDGKEKETWHKDPETFHEFWQPPAVKVINAHDMTLEVSPVQVELVGNMLMGKCTQTLIGRFSEVMELQNFPFDSQDFTVNMLFAESDEKFELTPAIQTAECVVMLQNPKQLPEYEFTDPILELTHTKTSKLQADWSEKEIRYPTMILRMKASRSWRSYINKVVVTTAMVSFAVLFAFQIPSADLADRLAHVVTLFLTAVAFQQVAGDSLPQIDYMTMLDRYILSINVFIMFTMIVMVCVDYARAWQLFEEEFIEEMDKKSVWTAIFMWVFVHARFAYMAVKVTWFVERPKLKAFGKQEKIKYLSANTKWSLQRGDSRVFFGNKWAYWFAGGWNEEEDQSDWSGYWYSDDFGGMKDDIMYVWIGVMRDKKGRTHMFGKRLTGRKNPGEDDSKCGNLVWYTIGDCPTVGGPPVPCSYSGNLAGQDIKGKEGKVFGVDANQLNFDLGTFRRHIVAPLEESFQTKDSDPLGIPLLSSAGTELARMTPGRSATVGF